MALIISSADSRDPDRAAPWLFARLSSAAVNWGEVPEEQLAARAIDAPPVVTAAARAVVALEIVPVIIAPAPVAPAPGRCHSKVLGSVRLTVGARDLVSHQATAFPATARAAHLQHSEVVVVCPIAALRRPLEHGGLACRAIASVRTERTVVRVHTSAGGAREHGEQHENEPLESHPTSRAERSVPQRAATSRRAL